MAEDQQSNKLKMRSPDLTEVNIRKLAELFPNCVTEAEDEDGKLKRSIDVDQLRQELSDHVVDGPRERYQLNWPGKREALLEANSLIVKTLRPYREESVDFDTTKNLFIEGDNLDALKLLQETYLNKVKMIYIDPPYNTGNDFIYYDNLIEDSNEFLIRSTQKDESGNRLVANPISNGRFHSDWLSMIFSRLRLARSLLSDDGVIFISIDDVEIQNLRSICDEIFGAKKFIACFVWKSRQNIDNRTVTGASVDHEYILCYGESIRGSERNKDQYSNPDDDPRGEWASANMVGIATADRRPNLHYDLIDLGTGINYGCPKMGWRYDRSTMQRLISENRILWPASTDGRPRRKAFLNELDSDFTGFSTMIGDGIYTRDGTSDMVSLFGERVFSFPKPVALMKILVEQAADQNDIVVDFFAGSGATAQAVMEQNVSDGANRRFILIQIPEALNPNNSEQKTAADFCDKIGRPRNIAELTKERLQKAGVQTQENVGVTRQLDVGFRVLKIDASNMKDVYYTPDTVSQDGLFGQIDNIREGRTDEDLLFQILLDWGIDLSLPILSENIAGKTVHFVDENALAACFEAGVDEELVKVLAERKPLRAVFLDSGYGSDSTKINVEQIFKLISPATEVKTI